jgi:hypothetical protein
MPSRKLLIKLLFVPLLFLSQGVFALSNVILDSYTVSQTKEGYALAINFNQRVGYLAHFPSNKGNTLDIKLRRLSITAETSGFDPFTDRLAISRQDASILKEITYEQGTPGQGHLFIEFKRQVIFSVRSESRSGSIVVFVKTASKRETLPDSTAQTSATDLPIYELNLVTSDKTIDSDDQPALKNFNKYDIYTASADVFRTKKYTLKLGYFYSRKAAEANLKVLKPYYPRARVDKISPERRVAAEKWLQANNLKTAKKTAKAAPAAATSRLDRLAERGKQAMIDKNYKSAIRYFSRILEFEDSKYHKEARELLGLARERNNQFAHAKAEYETYLKEYPEGEDAQRVKQRLQGLITARSGERKSLKKNVNKAAEPEWNMFGSLSQFYRHEMAGTEITDDQTIDSSLLSDFVFSGRKRGLEWNQRFDLVMTHRYDFLNDLDPSEGNVYTLFYDIADKDNDLAFRIGRQTHSSDGVLGRFDGMILRKQMTNNTRVNLLAGYPVELNLRDGVNTDRQFYAVSVDFESILQNIDSKFFYISQENNGLTDRNAIGTEIQYISDQSSIFFLLDYDTYFSELNQATFVGNWRSKDNSTLNIVADMRNSPLLTTNNALIGQPVNSIDQLRQIFTDDEINQLAIDRTTDFWAFTVSATTPLSNKYQLNGDFTVSNLGETPASGGVIETPGTDNEYFYNVSLIATGFFLDNDVTIMGLRLTDATTFRTISANISSRFKSSKEWRWNPRLDVDQRTDNNGTERMTYKTKLIVNYQPEREWKYELELGYETSDTTTATLNTEDTHYYAFFGYIYDF